MKKQIEIERLFPSYMRYLFSDIGEDVNELQEIRFRVNQPIRIRKRNKEFIIGKINNYFYIVTGDDIRNIMNFLCQYSLYAYESEICQGYFTIQGGHRVGVAGQVIMSRGEIKNIKYVSSINIRIAHEVIGAADKILPYLYREGELLNTMIFSRPGGGKTTLLRDLVRQISNGNLYGSGKTVGVVDERSEIAGAHEGVPQNDVGCRTDLLDACPKIYGMMMLVRAMTPYVIAVDEIGSKEDMQALQEALQCGCRLLVTTYAATFHEVQSKEWYGKVVEKKLFQRYILLEGKEKVGKISHIYNADGECL